MRSIPLSLIWFLPAVFAVSSLQSVTATEGQQDMLTAKQILKRMAETYASCKSYSDSGVVKTFHDEAAWGPPWEKPFTTGFVRPDRFRFEFRDKKAGNGEYLYIVWRNG